MNRKPHNELTDVSKMTRDQVVPYYVDLIYAGQNKDTLRINNLILSRWSDSGLIYIKEAAWRIVNATHRARTYADT